MEKATTLKEIAHELNLSINTISRALRDCDDISKETKRLVINTAIALGYMPKSINQFAQKENASKLIAIISGESKNLYYMLCANKISSCLVQNYQYSSTTINCHTMEADIDVIRQCISQRVDGIVSLISIDDEALKICHLNNIPVVCVGRYDMINKTNCVHIDIDGGTRLWANYLVNFHKSNKIIYVGIGENISEDNARYNSFLKNVRSLIKDVDIPRYSYDNQEIIDEIQKTNGELSIVCFNDEFAYLLIDKINMIIPNIRRLFPHFHIIGFDSISTHLLGVMDLASIDYDYDELANQSCIMLDESFQKNTDKPQLIIIPVGLHLRRII